MAPISFARRRGISISVSPTASPTAKPIAAYRPGTGQTPIGSIPLSCALRKRACAFRCSPAGGAFRLPLCWQRKRVSLRRPSCLRRKHTIARIANGTGTSIISPRLHGQRGLTLHVRSGACCRAPARRARTDSSGSTATTMRSRLAEVSTRPFGWCGACDQRLDRRPLQRLSQTNWLAIAQRLPTRRAPVASAGAAIGALAPHNRRRATAKSRQRSPSER
jgi:hypothetical protein